MKTQFLFKITALLFTVFIGFVIYSANAGNDLFVFRIKMFPYGDKFAHATLMGLLTFLLNLAMNGKTIKWRNQKWLLMSLLMIPLVTIEEFSQIFLDNKSFDLLDLLANYIGIAIASWAILKMKGKSFFLAF